ncbi:hypothetical protein BM477_06140 [Boudabousia marimammalium]|uniref:Osmotically inducible protein OsmC n=1 Tax=Boudabousia marimammalium TaxID=156892 RepID=A0A1Q5PM40_9ACTO|nr:hypothetical protein BM477_06140 [Boudabousia marimammalium]
MTDDPAADSGATKELWAERTGVRTFVGRSASGAEVKIGKGPGEFSPGDLIKLAIATCNAMSADHTISRALGTRDFVETVGVSGTVHETEERFDNFQIEMVLSGTELSDDEKAQLAEKAGEAIAKYCTVGNTVHTGASYQPMLTFEGRSDTE